MKKKLVLFIVGAVIFGLCACGKAETGADKTSEDAVEEATEEAAEEVDEATPMTDGIGNPWVECDRAKISEEYSLFMEVPDEATNVVYQINDTIKMAEAKYEYYGANYIYRVQYTESLEDISGMYGEWDYDEEVNLIAQHDDFYEDYEGNEARVTGLHSDTEGDVQIINWYDPVLKRTLCLCVMGPDLDGFDVQGAAGMMYFQPSPDSLTVTQ